MKRALVISAVALILPAFLRRWLLNTFCGYSIAPDAYLGRSLIGCASLRMGPQARIGHFNVVKGVAVELGECARIGDFNYISGLPAGSTRHFTTETDRDPRLVIERHASITSRHYLDVSNRIHIGEFTTVAGARSQILTHAIDFEANRQASAAVSIGKYCFVGTACVLLRGSRLPDFCVLAANSTLARAFDASWTLYSGVPAEARRELDREAAWFRRTRGFTE